MLRPLLIAFGLYEIAKPEPVIDACERIGLANPEDVDRRPWALWGARAEGLAFVWLLARRESGSRIVNAALALAGAVLVFVPDPVIELSQTLVYENTEDLELKPWVKPAARLLGVLYLIVVALSARSGPDEVESDETAESE
ncbi:hypothetical protein CHINAEXTREME_04720 [Halobiforma lacisalsi AJ5]|uniref:Uncharacterized protein n=1 Tax=Natronobacterium lacisalsi AJ5 TaxID=358396 RepID=M0LQX1_NATLA|nr:hypothetical protein [Halobiforma lacisalsi]APW97113.1 hypothetical protein CHINAEXTREME_04720 [Halobiforma lacisalsi AJ5]EMA34450.1 hypothetical protein C445_07987 [Halobiforma lacisalsi AJ5]